MELSPFVAQEETATEEIGEAQVYTWRLIASTANTPMAQGGTFEQTSLCTLNNRRQFVQKFKPDGLAH